MVQAPGERLEVVAFAGPAPGRFGAAFSRLAAEPAPDVALLVGGVGDDRADIADTLAQLAGLPFPTFILPGGRDPLETLTAAHADLSPAQQRRIWLLAGYHRLQLGQHEFVVLSGAENGRYGLGDDTCGFDSDDLQTLGETLEASQAAPQRWLLSWVAPAGRAVSSTPEGLEVGSEAVAELATKLGATSGVYAWPAVAAAEPVDHSGTSVAVGQQGGSLHVVVPRLGGPALERADGSRLGPGYVRFRLQARDLHYLELAGSP